MEEKDLNLKNNDVPEDPIVKLESEKEEYLNGWKRAKADLINYKKEETARLENFAKFSNEMLTADLIPALDSFELSLSVLKDGDPAKKGMELIRSPARGYFEETRLRKNQNPARRPFRY